MAVCGPKGVGKTTFCRFLVNSLLNYHPVVAFLEADVGQCEFTPPGLGTYKATRVLMSCLEGTRYAQGNCTRGKCNRKSQHISTLCNTLSSLLWAWVWCRCVLSCTVVWCRCVCVCVCVCVVMRLSCVVTWCSIVSTHHVC